MSKVAELLFGGGPNCGIYDIYYEGERVLKAIDFYATFACDAMIVVAPVDVDISRLRFELVGRNGNSSGYRIRPRFHVSPDAIYASDETLARFGITQAELFDE